MEWELHGQPLPMYLSKIVEFGFSCTGDVLGSFTLGSRIVYALATCADLFGGKMWCTGEYSCLFEGDSQGSWFPNDHIVVSATPSNEAELASRW